MSGEVKKRITTPVEKKEEYEGNFDTMITTGSTLLDLAISGGRIRGGGIPGGILVEIFGPSGSGKTVLLCEIAGEVQRKEGEITFHDPEGRLNKQFAKIFDLDVDGISYTMPDTVTEVFDSVRKWEPEFEGVNGIFTDSLAALSTNMEMDNDDGDAFGARRAKEFSEGLRKTCRILKQKNHLMVCSNQIRQVINAGQFEQKYKAPGGEAFTFYSSLRLRTSTPTKLKRKIEHRGKTYAKVYGVSTEVEVFKSSVWKPYRTATVTIDFDYGIDDIRENLKFLKQHTGATMYMIGEEKLAKSLDTAIELVETNNMEKDLREAVIDAWEEMENFFNVERKKKKR
jgi:protein RecA